MSIKTKKKKKVKTASLMNLKGVKGSNYPQNELAYKKEYCKKIIDYFKKERNRLYKVDVVGDKSYRMPVKLPTFQGFAIKLGVTTETLLRWTRLVPEFLEAYNVCREIQQECLVQRGLAGIYPEKFAVFVAQNYTMLRQKTLLGGVSDESPIKLESSVSDTTMSKIKELIKND